MSSVVPQSTIDRLIIKSYWAGALLVSVHQPNFITERAAFSSQTVSTVLGDEAPVRNVTTCPFIIYSTTTYSTVPGTRTVHM
jgi:hypothetical protein